MQLPLGQELNMSSKGLHRELVLQDGISFHLMYYSMRGCEDKNKSANIYIHFLSSYRDCAVLRVVSIWTALVM